MTELKRAVLEQLKPVFVDTDFATECKDKLKYNLLETQNQIEHDKAKVISIFEELDIRPLDINSVLDYKYEITTLKNWVPPWAYKFITGLEIFFFLIPVILAICLRQPAMIMAWVFSIVASVALEAMTGRFSYFWSQTPLASNKLAVPEFALQTAIDLTDKLKEANINHAFFVESLEKDTLQTGLLDPFLVLHAANQDWYLEVWNEPGFKQQRQV